MAVLLIGVVVVVWVTLGYVLYHAKTSSSTATNTHGYSYNPANAPKSQQNSSSTNSGQSSQTTTPSPTPCHNTNYLTIKEWNVKFQLPCNLTSMDYEIHGDMAYLGSPQLEALESTCTVQNQALGVLVRATNTSAFDSPQGLKKIGSYYYDYNNPQDGCGYSIAAANVQATAMNELRLNLIQQTLTAASN
jgi:hypothetical protein